METLKIFISSIWGGIFISMGALIYCNNPTPIGAFTFSIGLLGILIFGLKLYTGAIGFVSNFSSLLYALFILLGNAVGTLILLPFTNNQALIFCTNKLNENYGVLTIKAMLCGVLISAAVLAYSAGKSHVVKIGMPILCVASFILMGAEHSIADLCYMAIAKCYTTEMLYRIVLIIIGNAVGSLMFTHWLNIITADDQNLKKE